MKAAERVIWPAIVMGIDAAALTCFSPHWAALAGDLAAPHSWVARVGADHAAITLGCAALWSVALWLAIGFAAVLAAAIPGRVGRTSRYVARQMLPKALLRTVAGAVGLGVLIAPIAADAHAIAGTASAPGVSNAQPRPDWPTDASALPRTQVGWPTDRPPAAQPHVPTPTLPSSPPPRHAHRVEPGSTGTASSTGREVLVEPGDSLWLISAHRLGPDATPTEIAAEWPRWYAQNRQVIGTDSSLIRPGETLHAPPDHTRQGETT